MQCWNLAASPTNLSNIYFYTETSMKSPLAIHRSLHVVTELFTDRSNADPSAFSNDTDAAASLLVRDRAMSEKRFLNANCGTLHTTVHQVDNVISISISQQ